MKCKFVFISLILLSCAAPRQFMQPQFPYPQNAYHYLRSYDLDEQLLTETYQNELHKNFKKHYFRPWTMDTLAYSTQAAYRAAGSLKSGKGYGENKLPHSQEWIEDVIDNANSGTYGDTTWNAINTARTNLRTLPTPKPFYRDFNRAGEGFPFDYLQNSALPLNTPIKVLNQSKDKAWLLVDSHHALGWIPTRQVCRIDSSLQAFWLKAPLITPIQDEITLLDYTGSFIAKGHIGSLLPLVRTTAETWVVVTVQQKNIHLVPMLHTAAISKTAAVLTPWEFTLKNAAAISMTLLRQPYGWGGLFNNRDCSAMIKDFYTPFGIWLPRNSKAQSFFKPFTLDVSGQKPIDKEQSILDNAVPYLSIIWRPGHIMLSAGNQGSHPMLFHNLWGLKTKRGWNREGRHVIGQAAFTTLTPADDLRVPRRQGSLRQKVSRLTWVVHPDSIVIHKKTINHN